MLCNGPIPNAEISVKVPEIGVLLLGKSENFQDRKSAVRSNLKLFDQHIINS